MDESLGTTEVERPAITPEEYGELRNMQAQQTFLQSQGYQAYNFIKNLFGLQTSKPVYNCLLNPRCNQQRGL